jgi:hypothetical protein
MYEAIRDECRVVYSRSSAELDSHYRAYFAANPTYADAHLRQARDIESALTPGWEDLADDLPEAARHRHHLRPPEPCPRAERSSSANTGASFASSGPRGPSVQLCS